MPHIHIALVGGQTAPVLTVIKKLKADGLLDALALVYSPETEREKNAITDIAQKKLGVDNCAALLIEATNCDKIKEVFSQVKAMYGDYDLSVNITSGTKAWSFYAYTVFSELPGTTFFYIDQNNKLWNLTDETDTTVDPYMPDWWADGNVKSVPYETFTDEDAEALRQIEELRKFNVNNFRNITMTGKGDPLPDERKDFEVGDPDEGILKWSAAERSFFVSMRNGDEEMACELMSPNIFRLLFNFSWFEYKIARMIATWGKATSITLNNMFSMTNNFNRPDNEVDVIFTSGGRRFFVEVKTSIFNTTDIDKFNSVVKRLAGSGALKLFVAEQKGINGKVATDKCKQYGIETFFFGKQKEDDAETAFHAMLDRLAKRVNK